MGSGLFAEVFYCTQIETGKKFAAKRIAKAKLVDEKILQAEVDILKRVGGHENSMHNKHFLEVAIVSTCTRGYF